MLAWLQRHAPDRLIAAQKLFVAMAEEDGKWPGRTDHARVKEMLADVQALAAFLRETGRKVAAGADPMDDAVWDMTVIEQWHQNQTVQVPPPPHTDAV